MYTYISQNSNINIKYLLAKIITYKKLDIIFTITTTQIQYILLNMDKYPLDLPTNCLNIFNPCKIMNKLDNKTIFYINICSTIVLTNLK